MPASRGHLPISQSGGHREGASEGGAPEREIEHGQPVGQSGLSSTTFRWIATASSVRESL